jgi:hypothetical protein
MINWKGFGRKRSWPNFNYYLVIRLEGLNKTTKKTNQDSRSSGPRFDPRTSRIESRSFNHSTTTFGNMGWSLSTQALFVFSKLSSQDTAVACLNSRHLLEIFTCLSSGGLKLLFLTHNRSRWPRGTRRRSWPFGCWDRAFESRLGHRCCLCVYMLCCPVSAEAFVTR